MFGLGSPRRTPDPAAGSMVRKPSAGGFHRIGQIENFGFFRSAGKSPICVSFGIGVWHTAGGAAAAADGAGAGWLPALAAAAPLLPSSSAIIRRMEARISSIDGSCAFAACVIVASPTRLAAERTATTPAAESNARHLQALTQATMACRDATQSRQGVSARRPPRSCPRIRFAANCEATI